MLTSSSDNFELSDDSKLKVQIENCWLFVKNNTMERFNFTGDWEFGMDLKEFIKSNSNWGDNLSLNRNDISIRVKIVDFKSYDPDPLKEQENTLNYILNNQTSVIESLCKAVDKINIDFGERVGMYDWFPAKMNPQNLGKILLVRELEILIEHKNNFAYYQYSCTYKGDLEHGLIIVMHGNELIEYSEVGEMDYGGVYKDLGETAKNFIQVNKTKRAFGENQIHKVLPKYKKFKPWQLEATREYLSNLLRRKENETLIKIIDNNDWDYNYQFSYDNRSFIDFAINYGNLEIVKHLIGKGADFSKSILSCGGIKEVVKLVVENGGNIDTLAVNGKTPFGNEVLNYGFVMLRLTSISEKDTVRYRPALNHVKEAEHRLSFYLEMGANPNDCDGQGGDFKSIIGGRWSRNIELLGKIFGGLEEMISKYSPK